jgi:peptidoglycan/LPS O-acetylase OafA/YrhL
MEPRASRSTGRIPTLDGLRAISLAMVLLGHLDGTRNYPRALEPLGQFADMGVRIFFVLSGFLITGLLLRERSKTGAISLRLFYLRRVFRIFPAAYVFIAVMGVLSFRSVIALNPHDLLFAVTYTSNFNLHRSWNFGHLWSLSVEEQFYLLWPAVLVLWGAPRAAKLAWVVIAVSPLVRMLVWYLSPVWREGIGVIFPTIADPLAAGCILALQRDWLWAQGWYRRILTSPYFWLVPFAVFAGDLTRLHPRVSFVIAQPIMNLAIAMSLDYCMRHATSWVGRVLDWRPMAFVGVLSYSIYLWQQLFLNRDGVAVWNSFPLNLCLTILCALASYKLVEQPFLRLKDRFAFERKLQRSAPPNGSQGVAESFANSSP